MAIATEPNLPAGSRSRRPPRVAGPGAHPGQKGVPGGPGKLELKPPRMQPGTKVKVPNLGKPAPHPKAPAPPPTAPESPKQ